MEMRFVAKRKMIKEEAINEEDKEKSRALWKNANRIASNIGKNAMLKEAQHLSNIAIKNNEFDINPYLLNAQNGVIDLRDGTIQPHNKWQTIIRWGSATYIYSSKKYLIYILTFKGIYINSTNFINFYNKIYTNRQVSVKFIGNKQD